MTLTIGYGPYAFAVGEIDLVKIEVVEFAGSGACFGRMDCLRLAGAAFDLWIWRRIFKGALKNLRESVGKTHPLPSTTGKLPNMAVIARADDG